jgi:pimeloyl-ACP methyl ester carboxylesterase
VKAPDAEHAVLLGSERDAAAPVRERVRRLGPDAIVGIVDEPAAPAPGAPWVVLVNVAAEHHIGPGRRWVEWARGWAAAGYRVVRIDQSGVGDSPTPAGRDDDRAFAPEWIDDMRHVVTELAADGARVGIVGLCSGSYSAFEVAMWEHVDAVFAINPRLTLYPAAKGTPVYTDRRRAAMLPNQPFAQLAQRHRILAGGLWRIYREVAVWHAPLLVLRRVQRRGTAVEVIACPDDAQHFTEVYALRPLLWRMQRSRRFRFASDPTVDHSLLTRAAQLVAHERATAFLGRHLPLPSDPKVTS